MAWLLPLFLFSAPALAEPKSIGVYGHWGAFRDDAGPSCYAISRPPVQRRADQSQPSASIGYWPSRGVRAQLHIRLSRAKRRGSAVLLRVDDAVFQLVGGGTSAWAPDRRADAEIVAAIRRGVEMSIETRSERGARIRDVYVLRGAATAIDAAGIACARAR